MKKIEINKVIPNKNNPRIIKTPKFKKLVKSIEEFPEMLKIRPIVVNKDMVVLGGNMRLKACIEAGIKEVYIEIVDLSEEKQKEFIIKDNNSFGEWDWDLLANDWNSKELNEWGIDVWVNEDEPTEKEIDEDKFAAEIDTYINAQIKQIVLYYNSDDYKQALLNFEKVREKHNLNDNTEVFNFLMNKYLKNEL
jgi:hypothetical protein